MSNEVTENGEYPELDQRIVERKWSPLEFHRHDTRHLHKHPRPSRDCNTERDVIPNESDIPWPEVAELEYESPYDHDDEREIDEESYFEKSVA